MDAIGLGDFYIIDLVKLSKPLKLIQKTMAIKNRIYYENKKNLNFNLNQFFNYILMKSSSKKRLSVNIK